MTTETQGAKSAEELDFAAREVGARSIALVQDTMAEFDRVNLGVTELERRYGNVVFAVQTKQGMADAKEARRIIREPRYAVDKAAKAAKDPLNELKRNIDQRASIITDRLLAIETPIHEQIRREEERVAAEKAAAEEAARKKAEAIQHAITGIHATPIALMGKPSAEVMDAIEALEGWEITADEFGDRAGEALQAKTSALAALRATYDNRVQQEQEAARMAAEREELARLRAEREAAEKAEREKREQAEREEAERREQERRQQEQALAAEREELARQQAAVAAQAAELERQRKELEASKAVPAADAAILNATAATLVLATDTTVIPLTQGGDTGPVVAHAHTPTPVVAQTAAPVANKATRPTDDEIIDALALHFRVHESTVIEWLLDMDLEIASKHLAGEFA